MTETEKERYDVAMRPIQEARLKNLPISIALLGIGMATFVAGYTKESLLIQGLGLPIALSGSLLFLKVESSYRKEEKRVRERTSDENNRVGVSYV